MGLVYLSGLSLARRQSAAPELCRVEALVAELGLGRDSPVCQDLARLRRAQAAFEPGEHHRLCRGYLTEDLGEGQRQWLAKPGQLEHEPAMLPAASPPAPP